MRAASNLADLVKIKEDGTLENAISFGSNGGWSPTVSFISVGSDKSVYICFQNMYSSWNDSTQTSVNIQFVRVYPDNHFDVLWPLNPTNYSYNTDGNVCTWTWVGMDSDPLQKGDDGQLYFKVQCFSSTGTSDYIYSYDPVAGGKPVLRSPANGSFSFESFKVDSQKHLYIKSSGMSSNYLRYYTQGVTAATNIYYSSDSNTWVRGYTPNKSGDALILNGYNINGMSGIIQAKLQATGTPTYDLLYSSGTNMSYIQLAQCYNIGYSYSCPTALITQDSSYIWKWDDSVLTGGSLDKAKLLAKVATLYKDPPTLTDENFNLIKSVSDLNDNSQTVVTSVKKANRSDQSVSGYSLANIISYYPD